MQNSVFCKVIFWYVAVVVCYLHIAVLKCSCR